MRVNDFTAFTTRVNSILSVADVDYESVSTVVTFSPTSTSSVECPQIPIINDLIPEDDESFEVEISTVSCQVIQNTFTVVIQGEKNKLHQ